MIKTQRPTRFVRLLKAESEREVRQFPVRTHKMWRKEGMIPTEESTVSLWRFENVPFSRE